MTSNQKLSYSQRKDQNQRDQSKGCCYFSKKAYFYYLILGSDGGTFESYFMNR